MTREEAVEELQDIKSVYENRELGELRLMRSEVLALEMAIKALSQQPCDDAEQIDYHDDFATALKKINDYEMTRNERAVCDIEQIKDEYKTPCSLCRHREDTSGLCDMCPAMPREKGENE